MGDVLSLATWVAFGAIVANENLPGRDILIVVTGSTVVLSILAHGLTANPLATAFGGREESQREGAWSTLGSGAGQSWALPAEIQL